MNDLSNPSKVFSILSSAYFNPILKFSGAKLVLTSLKLLKKTDVTSTSVYDSGRFTRGEAFFLTVFG